jgi:hypothetical protein
VQLVDARIEMLRIGDDPIAIDLEVVSICELLLWMERRTAARNPMILN